ncbi:hypothetical protein Thimo_0638 [Thioflavicoccus mobilis 8321]|uniref:Uncharacterized protein n=2 Tax=Thioflavicoccus mobilis TaxID=80679 RepID=L0GW16_9GAMM|nr:hypothetical protein Thimo_0638 [Thioflavicoccus mobilis 8321]
MTAMRLLIESAALAVTCVGAVSLYLGSLRQQWLAGGGWLVVIGGALVAWPSTAFGLLRGADAGDAPLHRCPGAARVPSEGLTVADTPRDWFGVSVADTVSGFFLAVALSGLFAWVGPGGFDASNKYQLSMWLVAPIWLAILSASFLFRGGWRAVVVLGAANALAFAGFCAVRHLAQ